MWGEYTVCQQGTSCSKAEIVITWWRDTEWDRELQSGVTVLCGRGFGRSSGFDSHQRSSKPLTNTGQRARDNTGLMVSEDIFYGFEFNCRLQDLIDCKNGMDFFCVFLLQF
jgi:hypothetical protein